MGFKMGSGSGSLLARLRDWWFLRRVVREVNILRAGFAPPLRKMPQGNQDGALSCPVARALGPISRDGYALFVPGDGYVGVWDDTLCDYRRIAVPPIVDEFGERFDNGDFPSLVA